MLGCIIRLFALFLIAVGASIYFTEKQVGPALLPAAIGCLLLAMTATRKSSWRGDPATQRQRDFANELGIKYPKKISKGDLSDLISERTGEGGR